MSNVPSLTVILPAHNAEATIGPAIASTLGQSYGDFELWVLENGSTDRTAEIAKSARDPRIKVFELGPVGLRGAMQFALENARSEWLARTDADDLMFPDRLKVQMKVIRERPDFVFIGTAFALLTPFGHIFEQVLSSASRELDTSLIGEGRFFANSSTIFRRSVALEVNAADPEFPMDDIAMWFRMISRGKAWEIAEPLQLYSLRPSSLSQSLNFYRQQLRVREKYAPHTLNPSTAQRAKPASVWSRIGSLELLAGHGRLVRQAARFLKQDGFSREARIMRRRSYVARLGRGYYRWRQRHTFRHRPDWEELFAPLLKSQGSVTVPFAWKSGSFTGLSSLALTLAPYAVVV
jgi:glycosyltransferase involved in cell wall biosynthesis